MRSQTRGREQPAERLLKTDIFVVTDNLRKMEGVNRYSIETEN